MKSNAKRLEHAGAIQADMEGLSLQQLKLRDQLMRENKLSFTDATAVARGDKKPSDFGIESSTQ
ncbi:MAG: hypothetical protein Q8Q36_03050 [bacterium]|nr:hypothetical protein [bacterium]